MLRILTQDEATSAIPESPAFEETNDVEFVIGRRQMASLGFVALVTLAAFCGVGYITGRAASPTPVQAAAPAAVKAAPASTAPAAQAIPAANLFSEPLTGARYIQIGAVDRGTGVLMAEGLRSRGMKGIIASGPTGGTYRVLSGPYTSNAEYDNARLALDRMGVTAFPRVWESKPSPAPVVAQPAPAPVRTESAATPLAAVLQP